MKWNCIKLYLELEYLRFECFIFSCMKYNNLDDIQYGISLRLPSKEKRFMNREFLFYFFSSVVI